MTVQGPYRIGAVPDISDSPDNPPAAAISQDQVPCGLLRPGGTPPPTREQRRPPITNRRGKMAQASKDVKPCFARFAPPAPRAAGTAAATQIRTRRG